MHIKIVICTFCITAIIVGRFVTELSQKSLKFIYCWILTSISWVRKETLFYNRPRSCPSHVKSVSAILSNDCSKMK